MRTSSNTRPCCRCAAAIRQRGAGRRDARRVRPRRTRPERSKSVTHPAARVARRMPPRCRRRCAAAVTRASTRRASSRSGPSATSRSFRSSERARQNTIKPEARGRIMKYRATPTAGSGLGPDRGISSPRAVRSVACRRASYTSASASCDMKHHRPPPPRRSRSTSTTDNTLPYVTYSTVQYSTVQYSTVQYSTLH